MPAIQRAHTDFVLSWCTLHYPDLATDHQHESNFIALYGVVHTVRVLRAKSPMNGIGPPGLKQVVIELAGEAPAVISTSTHRQMHGQRPR